MDDGNMQELCAVVEDPPIPNRPRPKFNEKNFNGLYESKICLQRKVKDLRKKLAKTRVEKEELMKKEDFVRRWDQAASDSEMLGIWDPIAKFHHKYLFNPNRYKTLPQHVPYVPTPLKLYKEFKRRHPKSPWEFSQPSTRANFLKRQKTLKSYQKRQEKERWITVDESTKPKRVIRKPKNRKVDHSLVAQTKSVEPRTTLEPPATQIAPVTVEMAGLDRNPDPQKQALLLCPACLPQLEQVTFQGTTQSEDTFALVRFRDQKELESYIKRQPTPMISDMAVGPEEQMEWENPPTPPSPCTQCPQLLAVIENLKNKTINLEHLNRNLTRENINNTIILKSQETQNKEFREKVEKSMQSILEDRQRTMKECETRVKDTLKLYSHRLYKVESDSKKRIEELERMLKQQKEQIPAQPLNGWEQSGELAMCQAPLFPSGEPIDVMERLDE